MLSTKALIGYHFVEQAALVAQISPQIVDSLTNLKTRYNYTKIILEDMNN
jgi:hypothetical protein